ncbi:hypothetical protein [Desulforhabdus amnigena]|jgi:ABC-type multidrug transport system permease subunit|uniref:Uncharacterized protein n=1 Tax=Desulforhabdus amnigena TaxID=40218 RepID=A0A9W6D2D0_9BACT|nr:hypothetical protein [Desulforhabdus amnigena]NLJ29441.1 hypothetical protein [Deltaproteobacteria bacterium]GLI33988.1 hypothetical protein DAMNIGENAA_14210 [Desulforhabdus amnigena]
MNSQNVTEVVVVDIKMKFWSMVIFMVKWVIASIPAFIVLALIGTLIMAFFQGFFGMGTMWWQGRMH